MIPDGVESICGLLHKQTKPDWLDDKTTPPAFYTKWCIKSKGDNKWSKPIENYGLPGYLTKDFGIWLPAFTMYAIGWWAKNLGIEPPNSQEDSALVLLLIKNGGIGYEVEIQQEPPQNA